ncbi:MAG: radical SAM protein, partial [Planctomycetota bacterium]|nr:radical SAM protein [Planctomycetota bacterium]
MINISKLYCGLAGESDDLRYGQGEALDGIKPAFGGRENSFGPVIAYNCTQRCNLRCVHCYSSSGANPSLAGGRRPPRSNPPSAGELTTAEAKQLLSQLAEVNCPVVLFSGGEPLLRNDLFELLAEAKRLKLRTVISSNGTLIDSKTAGKLSDAGVSYAGISIDGGEKFHDTFRQVRGSFKAALSGIENCKKAGLKTGMRFTITKANASEVPIVFDIAASVNVRRICFYHLLRTGRAKTLEGQLLLPEQTRAVLDVIIEKTGVFVEKGLIDEVLTVGNHADGPYLLVRMQKEKNANFHRA